MSLLQSIALPAWTEKFKASTSTCHQCNRSLVLPRYSPQKAGIRMHDRWYCSSQCFQEAAEEELASLAFSSPEQVNPVLRMPLELMLMRDGLLSSEQFREIRDEMKETGGELDELLMRQGAVSEKQLTAVRAAQWGCPVFSAPKHGLTAKIHIPSTLVRLYSMIPLHHVGATNMLLVGFVRGVEYGLLYAIEKMTGCKTQPCFVTPSDFENQMQQREQVLKLYEDGTPTEIKFESVQTSSEMARIVSSYGVHMEADEAVIQRVKEYLWSRLKCGTKEVDLLFKAA